MGNSVPAASTNLSPTMRNAAQTAQWKEALRQSACDLRVAIPGIIQAFDPVEQVAVVQIAVREKVAYPGKPAQNVAIEPLHDVPVVMPHGGLFALTMPLVNGDECLLVFCDMTIDNWWKNGGVQNQYAFESPRHDLSDVVCIPGPWSQKKRLDNYSADTAQLRTLDSTSMVEVGDAGVLVQGPNSSITVDGAVSGVAVISNAGIKLDTYTDVAVTASANVSISAPLATIGSGSGSTYPLVTEPFYDWFLASFLPWAQSKGYAGPVPPTTSITTALHGG